jgi:hypothetical protein
MKKNTPDPEVTKEDLKKHVEDFISGTENLGSAKDLLSNLSEKLQNFESGLLKNDKIQAAKTRHLANLGSVLMEVLHDNDSCDLNDEDDVIKLAKLFTERYDKDVLSNIGM